MNHTISTTKDVLYIALIIVLFSLSASTTFAQSNDDSNQYDSIYRYNALENKISFADNINNMIPIKNEYLQIDNITIELEAIRQRQNFSREQINIAITKIENRSKLTNFLMGNSLGALHFQLVQIKDQDYQLKKLSLKSQNDVDKIQIDDQIKLAEKDQTKVENFVAEQEQNERFNLFGWLVDML
ncbi:MAG: hypothetical protein M3P22_02795 [bacterium]|nr:hypothetical protein [bacterium]